MKWLLGAFLALVAYFTVLLNGARYSLPADQDGLTLQRVRTRVLHEQRAEVSNVQMIAEGLSAFARLPAGSNIAISQALPTAIRNTVEARLRKAVSAPRASGAIAARLYVAFDTTLPQSLPLEVWHLLPEGDPSGSCTSVLVIRRTHLADYSSLDQTSLAGPCAFYARWGRPGEAIRSWLGAQRFSLASVPDADTAITVRVPEESRLRAHLLPVASIGCLKGDDAQCLVSLGLAPNPGVSRIQVGGSLQAGRVDWVRGEPTGAFGRVLGVRERAFFHDLVERFGEEAVQRFWTSPLSPPEAFARTFRVSIASYTRDWLAQTYTTAGSGPSASGASYLTALVLVVALLSIAARRADLRLGRPPATVDGNAEAHAS